MSSKKTFRWTPKQKFHVYREFHGIGVLHRMYGELIDLLDHTPVTKTECSMLSHILGEVQGLIYNYDMNTRELKKEEGLI